MTRVAMSCCFFMEEILLTADYADDTDGRRETDRRAVKAFCFSFFIRDIRAIRG